MTTFRTPSAPFAKPLMFVAATLVTFGLLLPGPRAVAQESNDSDDDKSKIAEEALEEGATLYAEKKFSRAIAQFKRGHAAYPSAVFLYNIAMAHMNLGHFEDAASYATDALQFEKDDLKPKSNAKAKAVVTGSRAVLESRKFASSLERKRAEQADRAETRERKTRELARSAAADRIAVASGLAEPEPPSDSRSSAARGEDSASGLGWTLGFGAGTLLSAGGSVAMHLVARGKRSEVENAEVNGAGVVTSVTQKEAQRLERQANLLDTLSLVSAGLGTLSLGVTLYTLFRAEPSASRSASLPRLHFHVTPRYATVGLRFD